MDTVGSNVNNANTARNGLAGGGVQTAGLIFGGVTTVLSAATETYDGTTFSTSSSMPANIVYVEQGFQCYGE